MASLVRRIRNRLWYEIFPSAGGALLHRWYGWRKPHFCCPLCGYRGPFLDVLAEWGDRTDSTCPRCGSNERVRLQYLVMEKLRERLPLATMQMIHFSPEKALQPYFRSLFAKYSTAGIWSEPVDYPADLLDLPFAAGSCDFIFASHVLEHIQDDHKALTEIRRVLKPGGIAVLPVPVVQHRTVEYPAPNARDAGHCRAPGLDYFEKYRRHFGKVEVFNSEQFPAEYQLFNREDRTGFPNDVSPLKQPMAGREHRDYVPVCFVGGASAPIGDRG